MDNSGEISASFALAGFEVIDGQNLHVCTIQRGAALVKRERNGRRACLISLHTSYKLA